MFALTKKQRDDLNYKKPLVWLIVNQLLLQLAKLVRSTPNKTCRYAWSKQEIESITIGLRLWFIPPYPVSLLKSCLNTVWMGPDQFQLGDIQDKPNATGFFGDLAIKTPETQ